MCEPSPLTASQRAELQPTSPQPPVDALRALHVSFQIRMLALELSVAEVALRAFAWKAKEQGCCGAVTAQVWLRSWLPLPKLHESPLTIFGGRLWPLVVHPGGAALCLCHAALLHFEWPDAAAAGQWAWAADRGELAELHDRAAGAVLGDGRAGLAALAAAAALPAARWRPHVGLVAARVSAYGGDAPGDSLRAELTGGRSGTRSMLIALMIRALQLLSAVLLAAAPCGWAAGQTHAGLFDYAARLSTAGNHGEALTALQFAAEWARLLHPQVPDAAAWAERRCGG